MKNNNPNPNSTTTGTTRRRFLQTSFGAASALGFPAIIPASAFK